MTKDGKNTPAFAAAITAATATVGPIIPPSIPMVLYAIVSDQSVGYLFAAGLAPGLLMALAMALKNYWIARRRNFPTDEAVPLRELPGTAWCAAPALMLPVILFGGILGGVVTPTEAAAVAAFYALSISVTFCRSVNPGQFYTALLGSPCSTAAVGGLGGGRRDLQLRHRPRRCAARDRRLARAERVLAYRLPDCDQPAGHRADPDPLGSGDGDRPRPLRGDRGGQRDGGPDYATLWAALVHRVQHHEPAGGKIIREVWPFILALLAALGIIIFVPDFVHFLPRLLGYQG